MKKLITIIVAVVLLCALVPSSANARAEHENIMGFCDDPYFYPILPSDDGWADLDILEAFALCNPSREFCGSLTTKALMITVLECPFTSSIYAFDTVDEGIEICRNALYSLDEFLNRADAVLQLNSYIGQLYLEYNNSGEDYSIEYYVANRLREYLFKQNYSSPDVFVDPFTGYTATYVHTPHNSSVMVYIGLTWSDHGVTEAEAITASNDHVSTYSATIVSPPHPSYNCHAYAWHSAYSTAYWMDNPSAYMTDNSYYHVNSASVGRKVTYTSSAGLQHSGRVTSISGSTVYVTSKWGCSALFLHKLKRNPYYVVSYATTIDYWALT